jgi:hypothetical protein
MSYNAHSSHDTVDVSDISIVTDIACRNCDLTDERLSKPCPGFEFKQEKKVEILVEVRRHRHWTVSLKRQRDGSPLTQEYAKEWVQSKRDGKSTLKYRVVRVTTTKDVLK